MQVYGIQDRARAIVALLNDSAMDHPDEWSQQKVTHHFKQIENTLLRWVERARKWLSRNLKSGKEHSDSARFPMCRRDISGDLHMLVPHITMVDALIRFLDLGLANLDLQLQLLQRVVGNELPMTDDDVELNCHRTQRAIQTILNDFETYRYFAMRLAAYQGHVGRGNEGACLNIAAAI